MLKFDGRRGGEKIIVTEVSEKIGHPPRKTV
jgi:hypothetical protein